MHVAGLIVYQHAILNDGCIILILARNECNDVRPSVKQMTVASTP